MKLTGLGMKGLQRGMPVTVPGSVTKEVPVEFNTAPLHQYLCDGVKNTLVFVFPRASFQPSTNALNC